MANKIYDFSNQIEYSFDDTKILLENGKAKLKENLTNIYAHYHLNEATGATVLDSSGNGRNGIPVNNPTSVAGKLNNCLSFNGSQKVNCGNIVDFERTQVFSLEAWVKTSSSALQMIMAKFDPSISRGIIFYFYSGNIWVGLYHGSNQQYATIKTTSSFNNGVFHHLIFTYDGSSSASGIKIYVDGNPVSTSTVTNNLQDNIQNTGNFTIGGRSDGKYFTGLIDEVVIYDKELTQEEVTYRYNSGIGRENFKYLIDKPTIKPATSWEVSGLSQFFGFAETLGAGNEGNIGYQLSDDGANWRYWNGSDWIVTSDQYNSAAVVGANIDKFPTTNEKILFRAFLISDGEQQCELDTIELTATVGNPPNVFAGADKTCYDHETKKPFNDAVIEDPDGDIEQASAWYNIEETGWIQIPKGEYGTLQEAIRNFQYTFDNIGIINCQLKVIDQTSKETIDDLNMTIQKYTVTFNVKDKDGNHLANFQFLPNDGSDWQQKNSPFIWEYNYYSEVRDIIFDKVGFQTQHVEVEISDHTENVTLNVLGAVSPAEVADAVWDELIDGHTVVNSFGAKNQKKVPSENLEDYKADVSKLDVNVSSRSSHSVADIWNYATRTLTSFGNLVSSIWSNITRTLTAGTKDTEIDEIKLLVKRSLGLNQENYRLFDIVYNNSLITSAKIKTYNNASNCNSNINPLAIYNVTAEYDLDGKLINYKVIKE